MLEKILKNLLFVLLILFVSISFNSCEGIFSNLNFADNSENIAKGEKILIKGKVNLQGAVSKNMSKTAMPDFSSVTYVITATPSEGDPITATALEDGSFSIELYPTSYSLIVEGYKTGDTEKKTILKGKYINAATENILTVTRDGISELRLAVSPVISAAPGEDIYGTVNLSIGLTDSIIKSWKATWTEGGTSVEKKQSSSSALTSIDFNLVADGQTEVNKKVGSYYVTFELFSEENYVSPVLVFSEMINVFENAITSMWVSHGSSDFINADGTMAISKSQLENRVNYYVNQTTGSSSNPGSYFQPLDNIQDAVDRIKAQNDGSKIYTIYVCSDYKITEAPDEESYEKSVVYIFNNTGKNLNIILKSYGSSIYKIDCNNLDARSVYANANKLASKLYLTLENIQLCNANTDMGGGLLVGNYTNVTIKDGTAIWNNKCTTTGGGVLIGGTTGTGVLNIDGGEIYSNSALNGAGNSGFGGAIYCIGGTVNFNAGIIGGDSATFANHAYQGGAIYLDENCTFNHNGGSIKKNNAYYGAGVFLANESSNYNLVDGSITANTATFGAGIYQLVGVVTLSGGTITSNTSTSSMGNGAFIAYSSVSSSKFILKDNIDIADTDDILSYNLVPVYIGGNLTTANPITVWFYTPDPSDDPDGKKILENVDDTDYVKDNYSKFEYKYADDYIIDNKGIVRDNNANPSIASLKPEGVTLPSSSFTLPTDKKDLTLSTAAELKQLSLWSQSSDFTGYTFTMTDDINLENDTTFVSIGTSTYPFKATFDGDGYEIKNLKIIGAAGDSNVALFAYCKDAVIENLTVSGTVQGNAYAGGIVSSFDKTNNLDGVDGIVNCVSYVDVSGSISAGGIVATGTVNVNKCVNFGSVTATKECGGIRGVSFDGNIKNCVNFGSVTATTSNAGGIVGSAESASGDEFYFENCYNAGNVIKPDSSSSSYYGFIYGYIADAFPSNNYYLNESRQFKGGGTGIDGEMSYCRITYEAFKSKAPFNTWTDSVVYNGLSYPVPVACRYPKISYTALSAFASANGKSLPDSSWTVIPSSQKDFSISSKQELKQLSIWAGAQNLAGYKFTVTSPIDLEGETFTPIGTSSKKFAGVFDGGGKLISNLSINQSSTSKYIGLFGYVSKAVIENVVISGTYEAGQYIGGVAGYVYDASSSIKNCVSYVNIKSTASSSSFAGGICGENDGTVENCVYFGTIDASGGQVGGISGVSNGGTIKRCVNFGTLKGTTNNSTLYGGINGYNYLNTVNITDCYNVGSITTSMDSKGYITGVQSRGTYSNNYYITDSTTMTGIGNNGADIEDQIKKETLSVIKNSTNPFRTWTETVTFNGESYPVPVKCPIAPAITGMTPLSSYLSDPGPGTYSVSSIDDLNKLNDWNAADGYAGYTFVLLSDMTMDVFHPIGSESNPFKGIFDGGGNKITGLVITENTLDNVGLFSVVDTGAKICNLTVEGTVKGKNAVGGICGENNGTITNCMFIGTIEGNEAVAGICGKNNYGGEVINCVNLGDITAIESIAAGIVGTNGYTISDCANFGKISAKEEVGGICATSNSGEIKNSLATGRVIKTNDAVYTLGMIVGVSSSTITNCYYISDTADYGCGDNSKDVSTATGLKPDTAGKYECISTGSYSLSALQGKLGSQWTKTISIDGKVYPSPM